jgi:hypothetical protein
VNDCEVVSVSLAVEVQGGPSFYPHLSQLNSVSTSLSQLLSHFSSVISHVIRLENSMPMQTNAKLMDEPQQFVMIALGAVLVLFVNHHIRPVRNTPRIICVSFSSFPLFLIIRVKYVLIVHQFFLFFQRYGNPTRRLTMRTGSIQIY